MAIDVTFQCGHSIGISMGDSIKYRRGEIVCPFCGKDALEKALKAQTDDAYVRVPRDVFDRALEYFEQRQDASTDSGDMQGNEEMSIAADLRQAAGER